jgi:hypothetical protein
MEVSNKLTEFSKKWQLLQLYNIYRFYGSAEIHIDR